MRPVSGACGSRLRRLSALALALACLPLGAAAQGSGPAPATGAHPPLAARVTAAPAADEGFKPVAVKNPYWGTALFEVYQDQTFAALTGLMASQHFGRVPLHADEAEVLRGGLLLDYGLHTQAGEVFARLIERGAPPSVQDRAWYHLARLRHWKGLPAEAESALARIGPALPRELQDPKLLLQAQLQMARADYAAAAQTLAALPPGSPLAPYGRFNLGVARIKSGDAAGGSADLLAVATGTALNDDARSLRDKANLALGFAALQAGQAEPALQALERVRLQGPQSHAALLGFGWASLLKKEPRRSLVAFQELSARPLRDAPVLESQIAQAYALAEAGAPGSALRAYEQAIELFGQEERRLDEAVARARSGALIEQLLGLDAPQRLGVAAPLSLDATLPQAGLLAPLLAQHGLQEALKNLRDLRFLSGNLQRWSADLAQFDDMLAHRRQGFEQRLPQVQGGAQAGGRDLATLQERLRTIVGDLAQAEAAADGQAHATERERALRERLAAARAALPQLDAAEQESARERLRLAEGALIWHWAREYPLRQAAAQQELVRLQQGMAQADARTQALQQAQREEPLRLDALGARIAEIRGRLALLAPRVAALSAEQQGQAQDMAAAELLRQKERLAGYVAQARWAVAQLHDQARVARAPGAADVAR